MTISRRYIIAASAALAAVPALPKPSAAGDQVLLDAYARWRELDALIHRLDVAKEPLRIAAWEEADARFGFPRDPETKRRALDWLRAWHAESGYDKLCAAFNDAIDQWHATLDAIAMTPTSTPCGALVKAELLRIEVRDGASDHAGRLADSLVADLERLARGAA